MHDMSRVHRNTIRENVYIFMYMHNPAHTVPCSYHERRQSCARKLNIIIAPHKRKMEISPVFEVILSHKPEPAVV